MTITLTPAQIDGLAFLKSHLEPGVVIHFKSDWRGVGRTAVVAELLKERGVPYRVFVADHMERRQWKVFGVNADFWHPERIVDAQIVVIGHSVTQSRPFIRQEIEYRGIRGIEL